MATLKGHQQAMVDLLASGSGIPASASRLAHAMHDVLAAMEGLDVVFSVVDGLHGATTPGLNDKALAGDIEACRPKATPAERRVKELEDTVKQLREQRIAYREEISRLKQDNATLLNNLTQELNAEREQAGCRKLDTQLCAHDSWEDVAHGDKRCCDCGELFK